MEFNTRENPSSLICARLSPEIFPVITKQLRISQSFVIFSLNYFSSHICICRGGFYE